METFAPAKALVENPGFAHQRRQCLKGLTADMIDPPIRPLVHTLNGIAACFTLQCCYGHFVFTGCRDPNNLDPLPPQAPRAPITYRIAYLALCIDKTPAGERLLEALAGIPDLDPDNIQFGSATWFWERQVNSYALQVEPDRFKRRDQAVLEYGEALRIERLRARFFERLAAVVASTAASADRGG